MADFDMDEEESVKRVKQVTDAEILEEIKATEEERLKTHGLLSPSYVGNIESLSHGSCRVSFITSEWMIADSEGMIHSGFLGTAAEYTALAAINQPNGMMLHMEANYLSPVRLDEEIIFTAKVRHSDGKKREVDIKGHFNGVKVYEARATIVITEYHPLKISLKDIAGIK